MTMRAAIRYEHPKPPLVISCWRTSASSRRGNGRDRMRHNWQVGSDVSMKEQELRQLIAAVKVGQVSRRTFVRRMVGLGLTAPLASQLRAHAGLAQSPAAVDYKPTR